MEIGRRDLLVGVGKLSLARIGLPLSADPGPEEGPTRTDQGWHPLTRSLLDRAGRAGQRTDRFLVERAIHEITEARPEHRPLVIKWLETPTRAFEHLSRYGLDKLVRMRATSFWCGPLPAPVMGQDNPERSFDLYHHAANALKVEEHDLALTAPKVVAKRRATEAQYPRQAIVKIRSVAAQIGWLETSLPAAAAEALCAIEDLLSAGHAEGSESIHHQLRVFEAYESGLLATWETPEELVCVPVSAIA
jgi:hypothetical protein